MVTSYEVNVIVMLLFLVEYHPKHMWHWQWWCFRCFNESYKKKSWKPATLCWLWFVSPSTIGAVGGWHHDTSWPIQASSFTCPSQGLAGAKKLHLCSQVPYPLLLSTRAILIYLWCNGAIRVCSYVYFWLSWGVVQKIKARWWTVPQPTKWQWFQLWLKMLDKSRKGVLCIYKDRRSLSLLVLCVFQVLTALTTILRWISSDTFLFQLHWYYVRYVTFIGVGQETQNRISMHICLIYCHNWYTWDQSIQQKKPT